MKFLVIGRDIGYGGPVDPAQVAGIVENVYIRSFQTIEKWEKEGKAIGGGFAGQRSGAFIIEASSAEELSGKLRSLPFWAVVNWEVHPLQTFHSIIEDSEHQVASLKQMAAMMQH